MKRLTEVLAGGIVPNQKNQTEFTICSCYCDNCSVGTGNCKTVRDMVRRLSEIEDILGEDYDLNYLRDLIKGNGEEKPKEGEKAMAKSDLKIKLLIGENSQYRPCLVKRDCDKWSKKRKEVVKALFHCWVHKSEVVPPSLMMRGHSGGIVSEVLGLVENEDGTIDQVYPSRIKFLDTQGLMSEICFEEEKGEEE